MFLVQKIMSSVCDKKIYFWPLAVEFISTPSHSNSLVDEKVKPFLMNDVLDSQSFYRWKWNASKIFEVVGLYSLSKNERVQQ